MGLGVQPCALSPGKQEGNMQGGRHLGPAQEFTVDTQTGPTQCQYQLEPHPAGPKVPPSPLPPGTVPLRR